MNDYIKVPGFAAIEPRFTKREMLAYSVILDACDEQCEDYYAAPVHWVAKELGVTVEAAEKVIGSLLSIGFIEADGGYWKALPPVAWKEPEEAPAKATESHSKPSKPEPVSEEPTEAETVPEDDDEPQDPQKFENEVAAAAEVSEEEDNDPIQADYRLNRLNGACRELADATGRAAASILFDVSKSEAAKAVGYKFGDAPTERQLEELLHYLDELYMNQCENADRDTYDDEFPF